MNKSRTDEVYCYIINSEETVNLNGQVKWRLTYLHPDGNVKKGTILPSSSFQPESGRYLGAWMTGLYVNIYAAYLTLDGRGSIKDLRMDRTYSYAPSMYSMVDPRILEFLGLRRS